MTSEDKVPSISSISADKERINALFAPFRPREANPEHFDRKLKFWLKAIDEYGSHCKRLSFTLKELQTEFQIDGRRPACLPDVIDQLCREGTVLLERDFHDNLKSAESWTAWSKISASRVLRKCGSFVPLPSISYFTASREEEIRYVNIEKLQTVTELILSDSSLLHKVMKVQEWKSCIISFTKFQDPCDIAYLLGYLKSNKCLTLDKIGSEDVLIMGTIGTDPKISNVEKGKYDIARTKEILETQLQNMTDKKNLAEEKARTSLKQGLRSTAKHELKRKKLLEQRMEKLLTMVDNLSVLESQIEDAESDTALISAYETGKKALTSVLADKRLNVDHVTETMLDIQELVDQHADISAALSQPMDDQDPDVADLDKELEELLKEDEIIKTAHSSPSPIREMTKDEEEEVIKAIAALELDGLDDLSTPGVSISSELKTAELM